MFLFQLIHASLRQNAQPELPSLHAAQQRGDRWTEAKNRAVMSIRLWYRNTWIRKKYGFPQEASIKQSKTKNMGVLGQSYINYYYFFFFLTKLHFGLELTHSLVSFRTVSWKCYFICILYFKRIGKSQKMTPLAGHKLHPYISHGDSWFLSLYWELFFPKWGAWQETENWQTERFEFSFQSSQTKDLEAVITNLASEWGAGMD